MLCFRRGDKISYILGRINVYITGFLRDIMTGFGLPIREDEYKVYQGKMVSLNLGEYGSKIGVVEKITNEEFFLRPSLIIESFPDGDVVYRIEKELPSTHKRSEVTGIDPLREDFMERAIKKAELQRKKESMAKHPRLLRNIVLRLK